MRGILYTLLLLCLSVSAERSEEEQKEFCKAKFKKIQGLWKVFAYTKVDGSDPRTSPDDPLSEVFLNVRLLIGDEKIKFDGLFTNELILKPDYYPCRETRFWKYIFENRLYPFFSSKLIFRPNRKMIMLCFRGNWIDRRSDYLLYIFYVEELDIFFF